MRKIDTKRHCNQSIGMQKYRRFDNGYLRNFDGAFSGHCDTLLILLDDGLLLSGVSFLLIDKLDLKS